MNADAFCLICVYLRASAVSSWLSENDGEGLDVFEEVRGLADQFQPLFGAVDGDEESDEGSAEFAASLGGVPLAPVAAVYDGAVDQGGAGEEGVDLFDGGAVHGVDGVGVPGVVVGAGD